MEMTFILHGNPKPKQSARHGVVNGQIRSWQPRQVTQETENIRYSLIQQLPEGFIPFDNGIEIEIQFFFEVPKGISNKFRKVSNTGAAMFKTTKPDLDNLQKLVLDAMQGVIFKNDALIYSLSSTKSFSETPGIRIVVNRNESNICQ